MGSRGLRQAGHAAGHGYAVAGDVRASRPAAKPGSLDTEVAIAIGEDAIVHTVDLARSLLPAILAAGIATEEDVNIDTLAERLRADCGPVGRVGCWPMVVGAFASKPQ